MSWAAGFGLSLLAHAGLAALAVLMLRPGPVPPQKMPEQRISVMAQEVRRSTAAALPPEAAPAPEARADAPAATAAAPPQSRASALTLPATAAAPVAPPPAAVAARPEVTALPPLRAGTPLAAAAPDTTALPPARAEAPALTAARPDSAALATVLPEAPALSAAALAPDSLAALSPQAAPLPASSPALPPTAAARPEALPLAPGTPSGTRLPAAPAEAPAAPPQPLPAERQTAALAPIGALDPVLAETIAAFMRPGDIAASAAAIGALRDGIEEALAGFPCARLQTGFDPGTGSIALRGHVPDPEMRPLVLAALESRLGPGTPVTGDLLILPRPQCQMLAGIEAVGLPQSGEQFTDPRVIGPDAHVRAYRFAEGQELVLDLTAPDYDAVIHVDYFDASGQVIHLQPNEIVPAEMVPAKSLLTVGQDRDGRPALRMTVTPPFGQEIAVAFAASAPLYEGTRPLVEPAGPYLEFMAEQVAQARARDPGFMGEWVYFFVATGPE